MHPDLPMLLWRARRDQRFTQMQVAQRLGCTHYRYRKFETASERPSSEELTALSRVLRIPRKELVAAADRTTFAASTAAGASA